MTATYSGMRAVSSSGVSATVLQYVIVLILTCSVIPPFRTQIQGLYAHLWEPSQIGKEGPLNLTNLAGFWGGLTPENAVNETKLSELLESGVLGLKVSRLEACRASQFWFMFTLYFPFSAAVGCKWIRYGSRHTLSCFHLVPSTNILFPFGIVPRFSARAC